MNMELQVSGSVAVPPLPLQEKPKQLKSNAIVYNLVASCLLGNNIYFFLLQFKWIQNVNPSTTLFPFSLSTPSN